MRDDDSPGPYVRNAALCTEVTYDTDGGITGLVGLMDRITVRGETPGTQMPSFRAETKAVVQLVAGVAHGKKAAIKFETRDPTGRRTSTGELPIEFMDRETAVATIVIDYEVDVVYQGAHWLDVYLVPSMNARTRLLTRIPLSIEFVPQPVTG